jgi:hypothetical protein
VVAVIAAMMVAIIIGGSRPPIGWRALDNPALSII